MEHWTVLASSQSASSTTAHPTDNNAARKWMIDLYTKCVAEDALLKVLPSAQSLPRDFLSDLIKSVITSWARPSTHAALEARLAQMEAENERSKENARTMEEEYNRLGAVTTHLKARANAVWQRAQRGETVIRQLENQVQKLENELRRQRDGLGRERDNLKPEGDSLKREGDKLTRESDKLERMRDEFFLRR
jgi:DNA repair exonuclease SbcCD ATPase subunit